MKVLYDYQIFEEQKFGGISRYFYELMYQFNKLKLIHFEMPIRYSKNVYLKEAPFILSRVETKPDIYNNFLKGNNFRGKKGLYIE